MKYRVAADDAVCGRMLKLELDRLGLEEAKEGAADFALCVAVGQTELPRSRMLSAAVLIDCGLLAAGLPEKIKVLVLDRPFGLAELREFVSGLREIPRDDENSIVLYPEELSVGYRDEVSQLTKREFELFCYLYSRPYTTISRSELLSAIWLDENDRGTNVVDVYIRFLRSKLDEKFGLKLIRSKRGEGYSFSPDDKKPPVKDGPLTLSAASGEADASESASGKDASESVTEKDAPETAAEPLTEA